MPETGSGLCLIQGQAYYGFRSRASLVAQWIRIHLPMQGTWVQYLVWEDSTCHGATKPKRHNMGSQRVKHDWVTNTHSRRQEGLIPKWPSGAADLDNWELEKKAGKTLDGHPWRQSDLETHTSPALLDCQILRWYTSRTPISNISGHRKLTHWF